MRRNKPSKEVDIRLLSIVIGNGVNWLTHSKREILNHIRIRRLSLRYVTMSITMSISISWGEVDSTVKARFNGKIGHPPFSRYIEIFRYF